MGYFDSSSNSDEGEHSSGTVCSSPGNVLSPKFMKGLSAITRRAKKPMSSGCRARARKKSSELKSRKGGGSGGDYPTRAEMAGLLLPAPESPLQGPEPDVSSSHVMQLQSRLDEALKDLEMVKRRQEADGDERARRGLEKQAGGGQRAARIVAGVVAVGVVVVAAAVLLLVAATATAA